MNTVLTPEQLHEVNAIYVGILRKYKSHATDSLVLGTVERISLEQALVLAEDELAVRRNKILDNAIARGLDNSTWVLEQLDRLDDAIEKRAKKILADNQRLVLQTEREKSISKSRSIKDFISFSRGKGAFPFNEQSCIEKELYDAYLGWLMQFPPELAHGYCNDNPVFLLNMGSTQWNALLTNLNTRRLV